MAPGAVGGDASAGVQVPGTAPALPEPGVASTAPTSTTELTQTAPPSETVPAGAALATEPGLASETTPEVVPEDNLSAVVVTANRRQEDVQDVPIAIRVVSSQEVLEKNLTTSNDVERLTPNLSGQASTGRFNKPRWFLRGIGTNDPSVNLEAPIGIYQDEVFIGFSTSQAFPLFDLERVEVLKGPQGSLWGKNTTAGAVHYISKAPNFNGPQGYARTSIGNYGSRVAEAAFGAPIIKDIVAARAAFVYERQQGWAVNLADGNRGPDFSDLATRLQLLVTPSDNIDIKIIGRYRTGAGGGNPSYPIGVLPGGGIQQNPQNPNIITPGYGDSPRSGDDYFGGIQNNLLTNSGATGIINLYLGDYTLTAVSGWDSAHTTGNGYNYWPPEINFNETGTYSDIKSDQFTQELRLTSPREDRFNWIAGVHYFNWHLDSVATAGTFTGGRTSYVQNKYAQLGKSYAAFASAKFQVFEPFAVNGGLRYTNDQKDARAKRLQAFGTPAEPVEFLDRGNWFLPNTIGSELAQLDIQRDKVWGQVTFDITPEFKINENVLAYARFARGFRSGTFNPTIVLDLDNNPELPRTNPEVLYDWEVGAKSQWLGGKLTANVAGFYYIVEGVQLNVQQPNPTGDPRVTVASLIMPLVLPSWAARSSWTLDPRKDCGCLEDWVC